MGFQEFLEVREPPFKDVFDSFDNFLVVNLDAYVHLHEHQCWRNMIMNAASVAS